ncbi:hypothetical protein WISP_132718 [Willisornis vidua]|uniref:Uncharacterized protein n=1 Tax=Willisornis vidua TaxID=1566151 RepID=A0ABQ9CTV6_9PASS|nr:hypothetical protein WISP_132718 [Willisornis vidua]
MAASGETLKRETRAFSSPVPRVLKLYWVSLFGNYKQMSLVAKESLWLDHENRDCGCLSFEAKSTGPLWVHMGMVCPSVQLCLDLQLPPRNLASLLMWSPHAVPPPLNVKACLKSTGINSD